MKTKNKFSWSANYSVGNEVLDRQHKQILDLCVQIRELKPTDGSYSERLHDILNEMSVYAINHFKTEEALLGQVGYPQMGEQKQEHFDYQEGLTNLLMESMTGVPDKEKLRVFLEDWWIDHILLSDMKYKSYFSAA